MSKMKKTDYTVSHGIVSTQYKRAITVNNQTNNAVVVLKENHNKGTFETSRKVIDSFHTDDDKVFESVQEAYNQLEGVARAAGLKWRNEWRAARAEEQKESGSDPEQLGIPGV